MNCSDFQDQLDRWMEGERSPNARAHLDECPACRSLVEDLNTISQVAHSIGAVQAAPSDRLWASLRTQLAQEGLIGGERRLAVLGWFEGVLSAFPRPALAGAYLVALVGVSLALAGPGYQRFRWNQNSTRPLSAQLNTAEQNTMAMMNSDPAVAASLEKNLAIVDNYIALCEKSVQEEPESEIARDYLYDAYRQKADLLAQMTERGDGR
ncbi:MAG TPA: anti-sigma factor [Candidatus Acidoferrales bacterium]|nr:anti-sigma factor [Candidatus Acidoferrales bacterium]